STAPRTMPTDIVAFYTHPGGTPDHRGRTLSGILALPDAALEAHHDYIQLLFPLPESSMFAYNAPILTPSITAAFRSTLALRLRLRESFARMLTFYGFRATEDAGMLAVVPLRPGATPVRSWWSRSGHNHLRITRIIRSLRILGCEGEAEAFWAALEGECGRAGEGGRRGPGETSRGFWRAAARRPVEVPPE
ncbi:opioid growth factor receptor conserved region-domain-containing protein, partial [Geopyxis carbonaria]